MSFGIDYASVDGNRPPNWSAFTAAGGSFAWLRASFAYYDPGHKAWRLVPDPAFERDWDAIPAGITRGAYMGPAVMASYSPEEQVAVFAAAIDATGSKLKPGIDFPPCLDIEFPQGIAGTGLSREGVLQWIRDAVGAMRATFGCWPIIYTSGRVWNDTDSDCLGNPPAPDLVQCPLWLARYAYKTRIPAVLPPVYAPPPVPTPWGDQWFLHQGQGDALGVPGFSSTVDISVFRTAKRGDKGGHVSWLQEKLKIVDGYGTDVFEGDTEMHVEILQEEHGLVVDGVVGVKTFCAAAWLP